MPAAQQNPKCTLAVVKTREEARDELLQQCEPIRLVEALRNEEIDTRYIIKRLKNIAENGGSPVQIKALQMFIGMFSGAGMDYDLMAKARMGPVGPPPGTREAIDAFISQPGMSATEALDHGALTKETDDDGNSDEPEGQDRSAEEQGGGTGGASPAQEVQSL